MFGANTYRDMAQFAAAAGEDPNFASRDAARKIVISRTLKEPLALENSTLLAAGLVERLEVMVFPIITGASGEDPILARLPAIDLELVASRLFDGRVQQLVDVPTVR